MLRVLKRNGVAIIVDSLGVELSRGSEKDILKVLGRAFIRKIKKRSNIKETFPHFEKRRF